MVSWEHMHLETSHTHTHTYNEAKYNIAALGCIFDISTTFVHTKTISVDLWFAAVV